MGQCQIEEKDFVFVDKQEFDDMQSKVHQYKQIIETTSGFSSEEKQELLDHMDSFVQETVGIKK